MRAFVPSHITGFFAACRKDDPILSGSVGCGLNLALGAETTVKPSDETTIKLNGEASDAPVSRYVVERLAKSHVEVSTWLDMPLGRALAPAVPEPWGPLTPSMHTSTWVLPPARRGLWHTAPMW